MNCYAICMNWSQIGFKLPSNGKFIDRFLNIQ